MRPRTWLPSWTFLCIALLSACVGESPSGTDDAGPVEDSVLGESIDEVRRQLESDLSRIDDQLGETAEAIRQAGDEFEREWNDRLTVLRARTESLRDQLETVSDEAWGAFLARARDAVEQIEAEIEEAEAALDEAREDEPPEN